MSRLDLAYNAVLAVAMTGTLVGYLSVFRNPPERLWPSWVGLVAAAVGVGLALLAPDWVLVGASTVITAQAGWPLVLGLTRRARPRRPTLPRRLDPNAHLADDRRWKGGVLW